MPIPETIARVAADIRSMRIRGAGRIAAEGLKALMDSADEIYRRSDSPESFLENLREAERVLVETRPTAVALPNAMSFLDNALEREFRGGASKERLRETLDGTASLFLNRMREAPKKISELALEVIPSGSTAMTHCHSSIAVAVIRRAAERGLLRKIYVTETRPLYQGRITSRQLSGCGAPVAFIVDSAAGFYMKESDVMIVGADAIAMNGDVANKVGTYLMAALAKQLGKRVLVCAESYKIATKARMGADIPVEFRSASEIYSRDPVDIGGPEILNPAFDITPGRLIDFIVTELGIVREPEKEIPSVAKKADLLVAGQQVF